jgi:predicted glycoside hydrolase/deacetylase ChbG (UPF0249 family)
LKYLIVNADDFGLTESVSRGIVEAIQRGIVVSTSAMICTPLGLRLLMEHADQIRGRVGIQLQLTQGTPCVQREWIPSLLTAYGALADQRGELQAPRAEEIEIEWRAQVERFCETGLTPTHITAHQHVHKDPEAFMAYCRIALAFGVPARSCGPAMTRRLSSAGVSCPDAFVDGWPERRWTAEALISGVEAALERSGEAETVEFACHPGYYDPELEGRSPLVESRLHELAALCDPHIAKRLGGRGITLANWPVLTSGTADELPRPAGRDSVWETGTAR